MKKLMLGILVVIPIVVLVVVGLVTTFISVTAVISVESVSLNKSSLTIELNEVYKLDGEGGLFEVKILPEAASDKNYSWVVKDVRSRDANYPDEENGKNGFYYVELLDASGNHADSVSAGGSIRANVHCNFVLEVQAADAQTASCSVVVGGDVTAIRIEGKQTFTVGESSVMTPVYTPLDGAVYDAEWHSANPAVASVDANGIVTAVAQGSTDVWLTARDSRGNEIVGEALRITVRAGYTVYGNYLTTHLPSFPLSDIGVDAADVVSVTGGSVSGDGVFSFDVNPLATTDSQLANTAVIVLDGGGEIGLRLCGEDAIEISESSALGENFVLEVNGSPLYLTARYASVLRRGEPPSVRWISSNPDIVSVASDGTVRGLASGTATLTAESTDGGESASMTLVVQRKVAVLVTETTQSSLEVGLARETVFASQKYQGEEIVANTFAVNVLYPTLFEGEDATSFYEAFEFTTSDPSVAYFGDGTEFGHNILIFDPAGVAEAAAETTDGKVGVTVTVKAKYPRYPGMDSYTTASFVVTVIDGIAVTDYSQLKDALQTRRSSVALENDISVENLEGKDYAMDIDTFDDVYGNGHTVSAAHDQMGTESNNVIPIFMVCAHDVTFSNLTIRPNTVSQESGSLDMADTQQFEQGYAIWFNREEMEKVIGDHTNDTVRNGRVEYCLLENARSLIQLRGAQVTVEGSVIRNTRGCGIHISTYTGTSKNKKTRYNDFTIINCVMSNMAGLGFSIEYGSANYTESADARTTFTQKGFLDIYNWQPLDNINLIPRDVLEQQNIPESLIEMLVGMLGNILASEPTLESFRRDSDGYTHMHLGMLSLGFSKRSFIEYGYTEDGELVDAAGNVYEFDGNEIKDTGKDVSTDDINWNMTFEDKRFKYFSSHTITNLGDVILSLLKYPVGFWGYDDDTTDLIPGSTYTINSRLIARLHGEQI